MGGGGGGVVFESVDGCGSVGDDFHGGIKATALANMMLHTINGHITSWSYLLHH